MGGDSNIATPTHPSLSVRIYFILPDLSFLGFWNIPLPWCPQVLFGGGGCLFIVGFPHPNLLSKPCPQAQRPPPQFQGLWLLVTSIMAPHCIKPIGQQPLVFLLPDSGCLRIPHPHSSPEKTTACGFLPFRGHTLLPPADSCSSCSSPTDTAPLLVISSHPRASAS